MKLLRHLLKKPNKELKLGHTIRLSKSDKARMQKKADAYTDGNVSEWLRYAALRHKPNSKELSIK